MKRILFAAIVAFSTSTAFAGSLQLNDPEKWVVIASRTSFEEAKDVAGSFVGFFDKVSVVRAANGRYAVAIGPTVGFDLEGKKRNGSIPQDSYLSSGSNLVDTLWESAENAPNPVAEIRSPAPPDHTVCRDIQEDGLRLACHDKLNGRAVRSSSVINVSKPVAAATQKSEPSRQVTLQPGNKVEAVSAVLSHQGKDLELDVYQERIELRLAFRNSWNEEVVGVSHKIEISNAFGDVIHRGKAKLDIKIPAGQTKQSDIFYFYEDNPFISGEPYDKMLGPVTNGTYKVNVTVEQVVFASGKSVMQVAEK